jgi:hypothetical protein
VFKNKITACTSQLLEFLIFLLSFKYYKAQVSASFTWIVIKILFRPINLEMAQLVDLHKFSLYFLDNPGT